KRHPEQRSRHTDKHGNRHQRDVEVGVVDVLSVGRNGLRKDGTQAAEIAGAENESEAGESDGRDQRASASSHEMEVYRRQESHPAVPWTADPIESKSIVAVARKPRYVDLANPS